MKTVCLQEGASCTVHYTLNSDAYKHTHILYLKKTKFHFTSFSVFMGPSPGF